MDTNSEWLVLGAKICLYASRVYNSCNRFNDALAFSKEALELYKRADEDQNIAGIARVLFNLGQIYFFKCDDENALKYFQQALQLLEVLYPFDHPDKMTHLCSLSHAFYLKGEYEKALGYVRQGAEICERLLPMDHPYLAVHNTCIGKLLYKLGRYDESMEHLRCAADSYERQMTNTNRTFSVILNDIGKIFYRLGELDEAMVYYEKALKLLESLFLSTTPDHIDLAYTWKNIGEISLARNNLTEALIFFERARNMYERTFSIEVDHRDIAKCWFLIAQTHVLLEDYESASEAFKKALAMWMKKLCENHPDLALCHESIGQLYEKMDTLKERAIGHFEMALGIYRIKSELHQKPINRIMEKLLDLKNLDA